MKMNTLIIIQLILFILFGCKKENSKNDFPISLNYELLDSLENTKTHFNYGEKIIFSFRIMNNSDSLLYYEPDFINEEFFKVYKVNNGEKTAIGRSYKGVFCEYTAINNMFVQPNQTIRFIIPWIPDSTNCCPPFCNVIKNSPLEKGEYVTSFSSRFKFFTKNKEVEYVSDLLTFTINFKIE